MTKKYVLFFTPIIFIIFIAVGCAPNILQVPSQAVCKFGCNKIY